METHPLNMAHQQRRRADAHLINNRYDDAMLCHHNAAELLLDAMKSTNSSIALESITLQHSYHLKQKDLIKCKKEQFARVKKTMENLKLLSKDSFNIQGNENSKLQVQIYRAIHETDSLLDMLSKKDTTDGLLADVAKGDMVDGKRTEKTQETVVEELQILSQSLHSLVEQLVLQVEVFKDENMSLKERVSFLEKERIKYLTFPTSNDLLLRNMTTVGLENNSKEYMVTAPQRIPTNLEIVTEKPNPQLQFDLSSLKD